MVEVPLLTWEIMIGFMFFLLGLVLGIWRTNRLRLKYSFGSVKVMKPKFGFRKIKFPKWVKCILKGVIIAFACFGIFTFIALVLLGS